MKYAVRKATEADLPEIYQLVYELAVYEKEPEAVTASLDDYQRDFRAGVFKALVVESEETGIAGMALFFLAYSTWKGRMLYLDDLVIKESLRRKGLGSLLFEAVLEEARAQGARLLKWQVLDWNEPALNFYRKYEAEIETNWWNGKLLFTP